MSHQNKILTYMIENLGLPLMSAVGALQKKTSTVESDAEAMAKMLTSSVDLGMAISAKMNIPSDTNKAEALRFRMTALAANALAQRISQKGKEPSGVDIDSLKATTDSLFVFSENFSLSEEGIAYLEKIGLSEKVGKELTELHIIEAMLPVIAVMDHKDRGLFPNIAERLIKESESLAKEYIQKGDAPEGSDVLVKHQVLKLLSQTFITIYPPIIGNNQPIGEVWQEFDRQKGLIILLMDYLMTGQRTVEMAEEGGAEGQRGSTSSSGGGVTPEAPAEVTESQPPPAEDKVAEVPAEDAKPAAAQQETQNNSGTPLSFFKKD